MCSAMPLFYLHVQFADRVMRDQEGAELPDLPAAEHVAVLSIRELVTEAIRLNSDSHVPERVMITDESGRELMSVERNSVMPERLRN